jgi:hypothetical protein
VALVAAVALVGAGLAGGARRAAPVPDTAAYGEARLGSLRVVSGVRVTPTGVDLRGTWLDATAGCRTNRRLRIAAVVDYAGGAAPRRVGRGGSFSAPNGGEGGPSVGFTLTARAAGLACADGRWRPGRYSFATTTTEPTRALRAVASVVWVASRAC